MSQEALLERVYEIRDEAFCVLDGTEPVKRQLSRKRLVQLEKMPPRIKDLDIHSEAIVMHASISRTRAARATAHMARLRRNAVREDRMPGFEKFAQRIEDFLGDVKFTGNGYYNRLLKHGDTQKIHAGIRKITEQLNEMGYVNFVNSGTLLGIVRERGLLPHDNDIDFAVLIEGKTEEEAAANFLDFHRKLDEKGLVNREHETLHKGLIKMHAVDGFLVDLFPAYVVKGKLSIFPYAKDALKPSDILPLKTCPNTGLTLPAKPERLLAENYGDTWQVPDPYFSFPWGIQNEVFANFLNQLPGRDA